MKRTTLWALCACTFITIKYSYAQTVTYSQFGSTPSEVADDGNGSIGIGTTSPQAKLHIFGAPGTDPLLKVSHTFNSPYYFVGETNVTSGGFPPTYTTETRFVINNQGYIGIGDDDPEEPINIKHKSYFTPTAPYYSPFATNRMMVMRDSGGYDLFLFANTGSGTTHGGAMMIRAIPDTAMPSFAIYNGVSSAHLAVMGDGSMGFNIAATSHPVAHLDIRTLSTKDYLLNIANSDNSSRYLTMHKDGNVGIGVVATGSTAKLSVRGNIDLYYNSTTAPALRINSSTGTTRHLITDIANNLIIAAGVGGGANERISILGNVAMSRGSGNLFIDLQENSTAGWNAQLRFVGTDGEPNHIITEVDNELYIDPGFDGNATDKVKIAGGLETTSNVIINGSLTVKSSSGNEFKVGTDGKVRAREVQVDLQTIPDYVFDKSYKLTTIEELKTFINKNRHLPNIPSECEYERRGSINISELNVKLLEKVEELSLYIIELNERIKNLENEK